MGTATGPGGAAAMLGPIRRGGLGIPGPDTEMSKTGKALHSSFAYSGSVCSSSNTIRLIQSRVRKQHVPLFPHTRIYSVHINAA